MQLSFGIQPLIFHDSGSKALSISLEPSNNLVWEVMF